jgi:hypothetical protein
MKRFVILFLAMSLAGCAHSGVSSKTTEEKDREYSAAAVTLSDLSMKIVAYYESKDVAVPGDFDVDKFFALLENIYPDKNRVKSIKNNYHVSVRPIDGGYSVMLCDPTTDRKIMEAFSCHVNRVDVRSWQSDVATPCTFEDNWQSHCGK